MTPSMIVVVVVFVLTSLVATDALFIPTAGNALRFTGDRTHRHYVTIKPKCSADGNVFDHVNVTIGGWIRTSAQVTSLEQTLFGYAYGQGPLLHLGQGGVLSSRGLPQQMTGNCSDGLALGSSLNDGLWHHVALSTDPTFFAFYVDGRLQSQCTGIMTQRPRADHFVVGVYDPDLASGNSMPFTGDIDDVRIYRRAFRNEDDVFDNMMGRPATSDELAQDLSVALSFDVDGVKDATAIQNEGFVPARVELGGGELARSPSLVPSTAPIYSRLHDGPLVVEVVQDTVSEDGAAPIVVVDLFAETPRFGLDREAQPSAPPFDVSIWWVENATPDVGVVRLNGTALTTNGRLEGVTDARLVIETTLGQTGRARIQIWATFTIGSLWQNVVVVVHVRANRRPVAGGAGHAAQFDGVDDFYIGDHLAWPTKAAIVDGRNVTGLSAITIEFWSLTDPSCAMDGALFALGGNTEDYQDYIDKMNAMRRSGRWHIVLPDETGQVRLYAGPDAFHAPNAVYYDGWTHYAFVHDGVEGENFRLFINGQMVIEAWPWYQGLQDGLLDFNHVTLGTWTFWSEVYHKGIVDDFRLWNYSRSASDIQRDMYRQLTGTETDLYAYWTFDSDTNGIVIDQTGRGNDLRAGGCVPCEPRFYCQPYSTTTPAPMGPANCIPSAKTTDSPRYRSEVCFGGTICFSGEERQETHPTLISSTAPIGGYNFDQMGYGGQPVQFTLNGTDPDDDPIQFGIQSLPDHGLIQYQSSDGSWMDIDSAPFLLPMGLNHIRLISNSGDGGHPFANFQYIIRDPYVDSIPIQVNVILVCPRGQYLDSDAYRCVRCPPGSYSNQDDTRTSCTLCGLNEFQPNSGQTSCLRCTAGVSFSSISGSTSCTRCDGSNRINNPSQLSLSDSFCSLNFQTDNLLSMKGGLNAHLDFSSLIPPEYDHDEVRVVLSTVPQYGSLYQVADDGSRSDDFRDYFYSSVEIIEQYADRVIDVTNELFDHWANATLGEPDVQSSTSSSRAWAADAADSVVANLTLQFAIPVYVTGIILYENIGGGAISQIQAMRSDGSYTVIWSADPLPNGLGSARPFTPTVCPTPFRTDTLRITMNSLLCHGRNELDAVALLGATDLRKSRRLLVRHPHLQVAYTPPTLASVGGGVPLGYRYTDTISYEIQSCRGGAMLSAGVQTLQGTLGSPVLSDIRISKASSVTASVLSIIGLIICLISFALIYRMRLEPVLRASSIFFMNVMILGLGLGFLALLLTALHGLVTVPGFCMTRAVLFSVGFDLVMGSIIVKTARIVIIFELTKGARIVRVTNHQLFVIVVLMVIIDVGLLITAWVLDPLKDIVVVTQTSRYLTCSSHLGGVLVNVSTAYKGVLVLVGLALALKGRNVPSTFNEVRSLSFMAYTIATNSLIYLIIAGLVADDPNASIIMVTFTMSVTLFSSWAILVASKLYIVRFRPDLNIIDTGITTASDKSNQHLRSPTFGAAGHLPTFVKLPTTVAGTAPAPVSSGTGLSSSSQ